MPSSPARRVRRRVVAAGLMTVALGIVVATVTRGSGRGRPTNEHRSNTTAPTPSKSKTTLSPLRRRIVALAESQLGYRTNPANTYCNKYSEYFISGVADCGNANLDEEWCADFAAWVWKRAGARVVYQYINGDLNASSASFYEWGVRMHTWHPVGSGYQPVPGDVAVYGLDVSTL
ncbi:MAG: hypothetical protein JWO62_1634 [Acidimicrobiaceae bacterium]|nr:hypothetical protein [Acidimicrobiaceae bacterium]